MQARRLAGGDVVHVRAPMARLSLDREHPIVGKPPWKHVVLNLTRQPRVALTIAPDHEELPVIAQHDDVGDTTTIRGGDRGRHWSTTAFDDRRLAAADRQDGNREISSGA